MKVLVVNIDSKKPNLALEKVAKYHSSKGDEVIWDHMLFADIADKIYVSCIFDWSRSLADAVLEMYPDKTICGGSGWDLKTTLPAPIKAFKLRINWGFTTRGCIRNCPWCIVPEKEGAIHVVGDLLDLWDGKAKEITLLDNNILALPRHFKTICRQARENNLKLDFNQGLDCRLLTEGLAEELASIRHFEYRFGFDEPERADDVERAIRILVNCGIKKSTWYVLVGFDTTLGEDLHRLNFLRERKQAAYVMRYNYCKDRKYIALAQWANQHQMFAKMTFEQFLNHPDRGEHKTVLEEVYACS